MIRYLYIAEHWLRMNFSMWFVPLAIAAFVLGCISYNGQTAIMAAGAIRG